MNWALAAFVADYVLLGALIAAVAMIAKMFRRAHDDNVTFLADIEKQQRDTRHAVKTLTNAIRLHERACPFTSGALEFVGRKEDDGGARTQTR